MKKEETIAVSAMRAGFTLIEILVAVAIKSLKTPRSGRRRSGSTTSRAPS